jgi:spore coat polysaccharide biosynthesis protein SpsF (cytidylyltransferase family)
LRRADREAKRPAERELVTAPVYAHPETYRTRLMRIPAEMDRHDLRLRLDCEEDWDHAQVIYDALGSQEWDWQRIAGLLDGQPALRKRMAVLNRHASGG